jgi:tight adherence protein C
MIRVLVAPAVGAVVGLAWLLVPGAAGPAPPRRERTGPGPLEALGRAVGAVVARLLGRGPPSDAHQASAVGLALLCALAALVLDPAAPWLALAVGGLPLGVARLRRRAAGERAVALVVAAIPETLDLLGLVVGAGATAAEAVAAVGRRGTGPLAAELAAACRRADAEHRLLADALAEVPHRLGPAADAVRPLVAALADASRHGTALGPALDRLGADARVRRRQRAESRARRVPVLLLFPLVTCTLPALGLLTIAPLLIGSLRSLRHS